MRKITAPLKPKEEKYIYTEGINYFETGKESIWGKGDPDTLRILKKMEFHGRWLNLAAGDGRSYNLILLKKAGMVVASDIDASALSKLWHNTPRRYRKKLKTKVFNMAKRFPFKSNSFDGIFCTGTLHLFPRKVFRGIFREMDRVLKPNGRIIIDFATDITRLMPNEKLYFVKREPKYKIKEAKRFLMKIFRNYKTRAYEFKVPEENYAEANPPYKFSCKFILLIADRR